jgi:two-component system NtrC family response regulator
MKNKTILIVDDESSQRAILSGYLSKKGFMILEASNAPDAVQFVNEKIVDIVLTDFKMPGKDGLWLLKEARKINPEISVVIMTAYGTIGDAVKAIQEGAYDYLTKPIDLDELELMIGKILERQELISEVTSLRSRIKEKFGFSGIIASSPKMQEVLSIASRVAKSHASVLIQGESGTGKEIISQAIHYSSKRANKPFVTVNCAALNENLIESELFGHEKGSFTGADKQRIGRFETADGGTIFLDEVGDLPQSTQVKLLRVLQEGRFERVGSSKSIEVDVRVIAATNKVLMTEIAGNKFREDLYYRLNVVNIYIPPLRERKEDVSELINHFVKKYSFESQSKEIEISREAQNLLMRYDYPGNVRELENIIHRAIVLSRDGFITTDDILISDKSKYIDSDLSDMGLNERVEQLEKEMIFKALSETSGNQTQAAKLLGISERNLRYKLEKYGLK